MALRSTILALASMALAWGQNPAITITVDAAANRRAISPNVYGMAWADPAALADLNCPVNRQGGNSTSATTGRSTATIADKIGISKALATRARLPGSGATRFFPTQERRARRP